MDKSKHLSVLF